MRLRTATAFLMLSAFELTALPANASRYDIALAEFLEHGEISEDRNGFKSFATDLSLAFQPHFVGPAATHGSLGFDVGYTLSITDIEQDASYWTKPVKNPGDLLLVSQFSVRKGLPYSFEVGGVLSHMHDSRLWGIGLELKWAFSEGSGIIPDIGMRLHLGTIVGSQDISLLATGVDLLVGKTIGLGGVVKLIPFVAYSFSYTNANSHVLGVFEAHDIQPRTGILPDQHILAHRGVLGLRFSWTIASIGMEVALGETHTFSIRTSFSF